MDDKKETADEHGLFRIEYQLTEPKMIHGDYLRITQALKILLDNANKYAPAHSVIELKIAEQEKFLAITIENSLDQQISDVSRLFDSFQRGDRNQISGTGLGLAIAKQVIRRHQGEIYAETDQDKFKITILLPSL